MKRALLILLILTFHLLSPALLADLLTEKKLNQAFLHFCNGQALKADSILGEVLEKSPDRLDALLLKETFLPERANRFFEKIATRSSKEQWPDSPLERVLLAWTLLERRHPNLLEIEELIDSPTSSIGIEKVRLIIRANLHLIRLQSDQAFTAIEQAFDLGERTDPSLLAVLISLKVRDARLQQKQEKLKSMISSVDARDPYRPLLEGLKRADSTEIRKTNFENFKKAYEACPHDGFLAQTYALMEFYRVYDPDLSQSEAAESLKLAFETLQKISRERNEYPTHVDIYLGASALALRNLEAASHHLEKARRASLVYLDPEENMMLGQYEDMLRQQKRVQFFTPYGEFYGFAMLTAAALLFVVLVRLRRRFKAKSG